MSPTIIKAIAATGVVGALAVGAPFLIGKQVERDFRAAIAAAPDHYPYPITLVRYDRGVFSSIAETRQTIDIGPDSDDITVGDDGEAIIPPSRLVPVTLQHAISHGPRLDGIRLARLVNTVKFDGEWQALVARLFGEAAPVSLTVDIGLGGGVSGALRSPAIDATLPADGDGRASHVQWSGIDSQFSSVGDRLTGTLEAPRLTLDDGAFVMGPASARMDLTFIAQAVATGTFESSWASVAVTSPALSMSMKGIRMDSDTVDMAGTLKSATNFSIDSLQFNDIRVDDSRLRLVLDRLDAKALAELSRSSNRYTAEHGSNAADSAADLRDLLAALQPSLAALAADQPIFEMEELSFTAPQGKVRIESRVQYVGDASLEVFAVGTDVAASAKVEAPMALIELLLQLQTAKTVIVGPDGEPVSLSPEQVAAATSASRDGMVAQGLLIVDGDRARSEIEFKGGVVTVNGKPFGTPPI